MSTTDNSELLASMASELTSTPAEREAAVEPDQDDVSRYAEYQARTIAGAEPVHHADDAEEDAEAEAETDLTGQQRVPLAALRQERQKRQQLQAQLQQLQAAAQQQDQQFRAWAAQVQQQAQLAGQQAQQPQAPQLPQEAVDFEADPVAAHAALQAKVDALQATEAQRQQMQEVAARENHVRQVVAANAQAIAAEVEPLEREFKQTHGDFDDAFTHLQRVADQQIAEKYPHVPAAQREFIKIMALSTLHEQCKARGENPCAVLYREAQRLGFKAQARAVAQPAGVPRLDGLSLEQIASMDDAAFDALFDSMKRGGYAAPRV